jgi:hypothetical protein
MSRTGRPRELDRDQALRRAMEIFWAQGYEGTTLADLQKALGGLTAPGLYAASGSKEDLFCEAVELHKKTQGGPIGKALTEGPPHALPSCASSVPSGRRGSGSASAVELPKAICQLQPMSVVSSPSTPASSMDWRFGPGTGPPARRSTTSSNGRWRLGIPRPIRGGTSRGERPWVTTNTSNAF